MGSRACQADMAHRRSLVSVHLVFYQAAPRRKEPIHDIILAAMDWRREETVSPNQGSQTSAAYVVE